MVASKVSEALKRELSAISVDCDETEIEYISEAVSSVLEERKRLPATQTLLREVLEEVVDIISPSVEEHVTANSDSVIKSICVALISVVFPTASHILGSAADGATSVGEAPLMEFPDLTLAYMSLELLRHTSLSIHRGKIYGLVGKNGVGKTTLMTKLSSGEVPGFPKNCNTAFVKHELVGHWELMTPREIIQDVVALEQVGFTGPNAGLADTPCSDLSGGWRMRTSIGQTIARGDIDLLLMDEPTNHLDRECVTWLMGFLRNLKKVAIIIVSHDEDFLNETVNYIIYFHNLRLKTIESNLTDFVKSEELDPITLAPLKEQPGVVTITPSVLPIRLPKPGPLDGVNSSSQTIARLDDVCFTYPVNPAGRQAGVDSISGRITLASRIALVGPNGAGKSTIVNLLVGSLVPDSGTVYRHPNLRTAFVSQHHVHHLEEFLDKTCSEYFVDRFGTGLDKEVMGLDSIKETGYEQLDREAKAKKFAVKCDGRSGKGGVECLVGRRKEGREYAYEVQWMNWRRDQTNWLPRSVLETELGVGKLCQALDAVIAQKKAGTDQRALDFKSIKTYLKEFGILEHTAEGKMAGLSGGQKSRVTLAAAMWTYPHLLVLDEPTNYLDAASLDSLLDAISNFQGAVVVISHNRGFVDRFVKEKWLIENGQLVSKSDS